MFQFKIVEFINTYSVFLMLQILFRLTTGRTDPDMTRFGLDDISILPQRCETSLCTSNPCPADQTCVESEQGQYHCLSPSQTFISSPIQSGQRIIKQTPTEDSEEKTESVKLKLQSPLANPQPVREEMEDSKSVKGVLCVMSQIEKLL